MVDVCYTIKLGASKMVDESFTGKVHFFPYLFAQSTLDMEKVYQLLLSERLLIKLKVF